MKSLLLLPVAVLIYSSPLIKTVRMTTSQTPVTILADMNKQKVDSVIHELKNKSITLSIDTLEYDSKHLKIAKFSGNVKSATRTLAFSSDKFARLEIFTNPDLTIQIYSSIK